MKAGIALLGGCSKDASSATGVLDMSFADLTVLCFEHHILTQASGIRS